MEFELTLTFEQYNEIMELPNWTIWNDPDTHDCENEEGEYFYTDNLYAKTPFGIIVLQKGRKVNGASIPWYCQTIISKSGKWNRPSGFHDVGYEDGGFWILQLNGSLIFIKLTQKQVDNVYLKLMGVRGVAKWNRNTQYRMLRMFGWVTWNKYKNDRIKNKDIK